MQKTLTAILVMRTPDTTVGITHIRTENMAWDARALFMEACRFTILVLQIVNPLYGANIPNQAGPRVADRGEAFRYGGKLRNKPGLPGRISSPGPTDDDPTRTGRVDRRHCRLQWISPRCPTTGSSCGQ